MLLTCLPGPNSRRYTLCLINSWFDGMRCLLQICITPSSNTYISFLLLGNIAWPVIFVTIACILIRTHLTDPKTTYFKQISLCLIHEYWNLEAKVCLSLHGPFLCLEPSLLLRLPSYLLSFHIKGDFNSYRLSLLGNHSCILLVVVDIYFCHPKSILSLSDNQSWFPSGK